jgi:anthranilate synthase/phosphoribosyltransferase
MILMIDNFDSFTFNLVQLFGQLGQEIRVFRNNAITLEEAESLGPDYLVISPGPCTPDKAGVSVAMIRHFAGKVPILGVCLGHQSIGVAFGGKIVQASRIMHGKLSEITHDGKTLFSNLPPTFKATRYHSLAIDAKSLPEAFEVSASTTEGEIMAIRHKEMDIEGLQFHPESIATDMGKKIIENFLSRIKGTSTINIREVIGKVMAATDLSADEMTTVMGSIMEGEATAAQIGSFITALRVKGETPTEIAAAAAVMRQKAVRVHTPPDRMVVDTCGTGGDGAHTFNISTLSALIAAGAGVTVAKHGNRSVSSQCGSADVLRELGVNIDIDAEGMSECLQKVGIGFLFAPKLHSAMRHVIGPRREIGARTVFNILGPLANPAFADAQVLGVYDKTLLPVMARVLNELGCRRALVVHGSDGLDEITLTGKTFVTELKEGEITESVIDPQDYGFSYCRAEDLRGGTPEENARITTDILKGRLEGPKTDVALLNAGAAILVSGLVEKMDEAIELARRAITSKAALDKLEKLKEVSNA